MMVKVRCNQVPVPLDPCTRQPKAPGQGAQTFNRVSSRAAAPPENVWANALGPKKRGSYRCTRCGSETHDVVGKALT